MGESIPAQDPAYTRPMTPSTHRAAHVLIGLLALTLLGCAGGGEVDYADVTDDEAHTRTRERAIEALGDAIAAGEEPASEREALKDVAWSRSTPAMVRIAALDALLADDERLDDTRAMLRLMVPTESAWEEWEVLEHVGGVAVDRGWEEFLPAFVASFARPQPLRPDDRRPERRVIERLAGDRSVPEAVFDVFAARPLEFDEQPVRERDRLAAWSLLHRLNVDEAYLRDRLSRLETDREDQLLVTLREAARTLGVVPGTGEQLARLADLFTDEHAAFRREAAGVISVLSDQQRVGLGLHHLPTLVWTARHEAALLGLSPADLRDRLRSALDGQDHHARADTAGIYEDELPSRVIDGLPWPDTLAALVARRVLDDRGLVAELFRQVDLDRDDPTTEHGGVILPEEESPVFLAAHYPPRPAQRLGDDRFIASAAMIAAATDAPFVYHFHARKPDLASYAGPSLADIEFVERFGFVAMVLTSTDEDTLNADFYSADRRVLDLGSVTRP